ncbi:hypothetical protein OH492_18065 [Vibrio chagasii]|nr:hypothetical protein [Vibrio chagasii]
MSAIFASNRVQFHDQLPCCIILSHQHFNNVQRFETINLPADSLIDNTIKEESLLLCTAEASSTNTDKRQLCNYCFRFCLQPVNKTDNDIAMTIAMV